MEEIKKDVTDLKGQIAPMIEKVDALEKKVPAIERRLDDHDKEIKGIKEQLAEFKIELAKCVRYYMFWIVFALLGVVGLVYLSQGLVFKEVTWVSYLVGILGAAIIATAFYLYYKSKEGNK